MDNSSLFSALSFVSVVVYLYVGIYAFSQNRKSPLHRTFLMLCSSYAVWSFAYAFAYVAVDPHVFSAWNKIAAVGWCSFSGLTLYFVLLLTENRFCRSLALKSFIFVPAAGFFYLAIFFFGPDIKTSDFISSLFYIGNFWYNFIQLILSILLIYQWGRHSSLVRIKKQAKILVICGIIPFFLDLFGQTILPMVGIRSLPLMGQLYAVIMILGTYHVITRYSFLKVPEKVLLAEIQDKIFEMVIILDREYRMLRISKQTLNLLEYEEHELIGQCIGALFEQNDLDGFLALGRNDREVKFEDIKVKGSSGITIPANIHYIPILDENVHDFLGALLIMQDIRIQYELKMKNELLYQKTIRDSLTNLYNYQFMIELTKDKITEAEKNVYSEGARQSLSLLMIDIDYFKKVNDTFGHLFGDYVLKTVSGILTEIVGEKGYAGRYGGEEFIVLLPDCDGKEAFRVGEQIRVTIEEYEFEQDLRITVSVGIKQFGGEIYDEWINNADIRLYRAKQNGRNQTAI